MDNNSNENSIDFRQVVKDQKQSMNKKKREEKNKQREQAFRMFKIKASLLVTFIVAFFIGVYWFANNYQLRSPILLSFQSLWIRRENPESVILSPIAEAKVAVKTDMEVIESYKLAPVIKTIYFLESTSGKADGCKEEGKFNGYGYRQNSAEWKCYDSFEQVTDKVNEWLEERLAYNGNNIVEAVCFYNKGIAGLKSCDYSDNFVRSLIQHL